MPIITGTSRHQISFSSLEDCIKSDSEVRFIDAVYSKLDLKKLDVQNFFQPILEQDKKYF